MVSLVWRWGNFGEVSESKQGASHAENTTIVSSTSSLSLCFAHHWYYIYFKRRIEGFWYRVGPSNQNEIEQPSIISTFTFQQAGTSHNNNYRTVHVILSWGELSSDVSSISHSSHYPHTDQIRLSRIKWMAQPWPRTLSQRPTYRLFHVFNGLSPRSIMGVDNRKLKDPTVKISIQAHGMSHLLW